MKKTKKKSKIGKVAKKPIPKKKITKEGGNEPPPGKP
jgi:hypothetical protein